MKKRAFISASRAFYIVYTIVKTYPNDVRVGYVPRHKSPLKQKGVGQSWFPKKWTEHDIRKAGEQVVGLKRNRRKPDGVAVYGNYKAWIPVNA